MQLQEITNFKYFFVTFFTVKEGQTDWGLGSTFLIVSEAVPALNVDETVKAIAETNKYTNTQVVILNMKGLTFYEAFSMYPDEFNDVWSTEPFEECKLEVKITNGNTVTTYYSGIDDINWVDQNITEPDSILEYKSLNHEVFILHDSMICILK